MSREASPEQIGFRSSETIRHPFEDFEAIERPRNRSSLRGRRKRGDVSAIEPVDFVCQFGQQHDADHPFLFAGMECRESFAKNHFIFIDDGAKCLRDDVELSGESFGEPLESLSRQGE